jgi:hypothetical protein
LNCRPLPYQGSALPLSYSSARFGSRQYVYNIAFALSSLVWNRLFLVIRHKAGKFLASRARIRYKISIIMTQDKDSPRQQKLADKRSEALRENLKKRKEQQAAQKQLSETKTEKK